MEMNRSTSGGAALTCRRRRWKQTALSIFPGTAAMLARSEEHTSELQSLMRNSYAVFCLKNKKYARQCTVTTMTTIPKSHDRSNPSTCTVLLNYSHVRAIPVAPISIIQHIE